MTSDYSLLDEKWSKAEWADTVLDSLPNPLIQLECDNSIIYLNNAAETFFEGSLGYLQGLPFTDLLPDDTPLLEMIDKVRASGNCITDHDLVLESIKIGVRLVNVGVSPLPGNGGKIVVSLFERSLAQRLHKTKAS